MKKICKICGLPLADNYRHDKCKDCKKKHRKEWWKKNWPWVTAAATVVVASIVVKVVSDNSDGADASDEDDSDAGKNLNLKEVKNMAYHELEPGDEDILDECPVCNEGYMVPTMGLWHQCSNCGVEAEEDYDSGLLMFDESVDLYKEY